MKVALAFLFIGILLLGLVLRKYVIGISSTIDLHYRDTYLVVDKLSFSIAIALILLTFFALGGVIGTKFRSLVFWVLLVLVLSVIAFVIWYLFNS